MHMLAKNRRSGILVLSILIVFGYLFLTHTKEDIEEAVSTVRTTEPVYIRTSTIPLSVSGVVEATDRAVVSAETAGVVSGLYVTEGSWVTLGTVLATQATPVFDATYALRQAEADLTQTQQAASVESAATAAAQAVVVADSAEEIAHIRVVSNDNRVAEAAKGVLVAGEANVTALLDALQFVHDHRSLFDGDAFPTFRSIVAGLYGSIPKQFQGGLLYAVRSEADLLDRIANLAISEDLSVIEVQNLYALLEAENAALLEVYAGGEREVLDRSIVERNSTVYEEYFTQRAAVINARSNLAMRYAALASAIDAAATSLESENQTVAVSAIDEASAERQAAYSEAIRVAAARVADASSDVVVAQQSLGEVRAPFAGVVTKRFVEVGEYAHAGTPLLQIEGVRGTEVEVRVPLMFVSALHEGLPFLVDGEIVGAVDHFSPVSSGNVVSVIVVLSEQTFPVGSTIAGSLLLTESDTVFEVPRAYMHFGNSGAFVQELETGNIYPVSIVYDAGASLYVELPNSVPTKSLRPAYSIALP